MSFDRTLLRILVRTIGARAAAVADSGRDPCAEEIIEDALKGLGAVIDLREHVGWLRAELVALGYDQLLAAPDRLAITASNRSTR